MSPLGKMHTILSLAEDACREEIQEYLQDLRKCLRELEDAIKLLDKN